MDKQVKHLARQLRDEGVVPERDLWPEIEQAIARSDVETKGPVIPEMKQKLRFNTNAWYRMAAVAATLVLLVGSGYFGGPASGPETGHAALMQNTDESSNTDSLLHRLNNTISELDAAMAQDPENIKLTRLSLLTHKSRANLLRVGTRW